MAAESVDARVLRLAEGFNALMEEYHHLLSRSQGLERSVQDAKTQFQRFVASRGTVTADDVQDFELSVATRDIEDPLRRQPATSRWWMRTDLPMNKRSLLRVRYAVDAHHSLGLDKASTEDAMSKISSEAIMTGGSSAMPSIVESPLEQDFTSPGTPSRLDCPFASMTNRRLSAHAASVVSKYKSNGAMTPRSAASRVTGRAPTPKPVAPPSLEAGKDRTLSSSSPAKARTDLGSMQGSAPICPIRFLDKNSPEEVADYFEKHKHELPRSHEFCVKRFGSTPEGVRQLDAKYGNLVSMIQGLGQKHVPMLPGKDDDDEEVILDDGAGAERVRQWADDISNVAQVDADVPEDERVSHFDRPMKDVRVGESPSRPWGIQVPITAVEKAEQNGDDNDEPAPKPRGACPFAAGGAPAGMINPHVQSAPVVPKSEIEISATASKSAGRCPFANGAPPGMINPHTDEKPSASTPPSVEKQTLPTPPSQTARPAPVFISNGEGTEGLKGFNGMTFNGPVLIGYSPEQAAAILRSLQQ